jgi:predicted ATPase
VPTEEDAATDRGSTPRLLQRDNELALIRGMFATACESGSGAVLVFEGEAGIGKSALVDVAQTTAREQGLSVLSARASELEAAYPFGVVRQLLEPVLRQANRV